MVKTGASLITDSGHPMPKKLVDKSIDDFFNTYREMSSMRSNLFIVQNDMKELEQKDEQIEELGEGFTLLDYENLKTETQAISSNIDQKQERLEMLRHRFLRDKDQIEHAKNNRLEMLTMIDDQESNYESLKETENLLRKKLNDAKAQLTRLRNEFDDLSLKAGMLNHIPLMRDYDKVSDEVHQLLEKISQVEAFSEKIHHETEMLQNRIDKMESLEPDGLKHLDMLIRQEQEKLKKFK